MKYSFSFLLILALAVSSSRSQLFPHKVNCETFTDPLNYNAYYERCVGKIILHKFCPAEMVWNQNKNSCCESRDETSERCHYDETQNGYVDMQQTFDSIEIMSKGKPLARPPARPPVRPPVVVRPPNNGSGSPGIKWNGALSYLLVLIVIILNIS